MPSSTSALADAGDFGAAANQPEVPQVARGERAHGLEIALVSAGDDHDVRRARDVGAMQPLGKRLDDDVFGGGKALAIGELLAVVDDVDPEVDLARRCARGASRRGRRR